MEFEYTAAAADGTTTAGTHEAASVRDVIAALKAKDLFVISVREKKRSKGTGLFGGIMRGGLVRVSPVERVLLARHLALILRAGLPIDRALEILQTHGRNKALRRVLGEVLVFVQKGEALALALARYPSVFSPLFVAIVRWGEIGGVLVESLEHLATQMEKDHELRMKVRGAFIYPAIVVGATVVVGMIMSIFILPRLIVLFESFKVGLPLSTRIFIAVARFIQRYGIVFFPAMLVLPITLFFAFRTRALRPVAHRFFLRLPIFGPLIHQVNLARFDRILGSLLRSGIPVVDALQITAESLGNIWYRRAVESVVESARQGVPISREIGKNKLFPSMQVQMIAVGEDTGNLAEVLSYLADFTERDVDNRTKNLATALEPLLLLGIGVLVAGVAISVITPIYQLTSSFSQ